MQAILHLFCAAVLQTQQATHRIVTEEWPIVLIKLELLFRNVIFCFYSFYAVFSFRRCVFFSFVFFLFVGVFSFVGGFLDVFRFFFHEICLS